MPDLLVGIVIGWIACDAVAFGLAGWRVTTASQLARLMPLATLAVLLREWWSGKDTPPAPLIDARQGADSDPVDETA